MLVKHNYSKEFEAFWEAYPSRVGKLAAEKAYVKARARASAEELIAGIARYVERKPAYADYCHPATWLNQGRWLDEAPTRAASTSTCPHDPQCSSRHNCIEKIVADGRRQRSA